MFPGIEIGARGQRDLVVAQEHTALHWGSGLLPVLSTPQMVALMELAAVEAVDRKLPPGFQTVGTHLDVHHMAATPLGMRVTAWAELTAIEGRKLVFHVEAHDEAGKVGEGTHERFIIEVERFMHKAQMRGK